MLTDRRGGGRMAEGQCVGNPPGWSATSPAPNRPTVEGHLASARLGRRRPSAHVPGTIVAIVVTY